MAVNLLVIQRVMYNIHVIIPVVEIRITVVTTSETKPAN